MLLRYVLFVLRKSATANLLSKFCAKFPARGLLDTAKAAQQRPRRWTGARGFFLPIKSPRSLHSISLFLSFRHSLSLLLLRLPRALLARRQHNLTLRPTRLGHQILNHLSRAPVRVRNNRRISRPWPKAAHGMPSTRIVGKPGAKTKL